MQICGEDSGFGKPEASGKKSARIRKVSIKPLIFVIEQQSAQKEKKSHRQKTVLKSKKSEEFKKKTFREYCSLKSATNGIIELDIF